MSLKCRELRADGRLIHDRRICQGIESPAAGLFKTAHRRLRATALAEPEAPCTSAHIRYGTRYDREDAAMAFT
jgi:hypothetical protein